MAWKWEQGRLEYFQFDALRKVAKLGARHDLYNTSRDAFQEAVGLPFLPDNSQYRPWRNYGRLFQIAMLAAPVARDRIKVTALGDMLSRDGMVTTDEYLHFMAQATSDPSPALSEWDYRVPLRFPLLFVLRLLLARATQGKMETSIAGLVGAYQGGNMVGDEGEEDFLGVIDRVGGARHEIHRQAHESIRVLAQISYLTAGPESITVSLAGEDAHNLFIDLQPLRGPPLEDRAAEIFRRARLFPHQMAELDIQYQASIISDIGEAGFVSVNEGARVRRTHLNIERNQMIRRRFFEEYRDVNCDLCGMDARVNYPWTTKLLEIHHLLPLCSGARTSMHGTMLDDLVANCPNCHRAVHGYYDKWLDSKGQLDFADSGQAREAYEQAKTEHRRAVC